MNIPRPKANKAHFQKIIKQREPSLFDPQYDLHESDYISPPPSRTAPHLLHGAVSAINARVIAKKLGQGKEQQSKDGWMTLCPCHNDTNPSLSLKDMESGSVAYHCFAGCSKRDIRSELHRRQLFSRISSKNKTFYDYTDEKGMPVMSVQRIDKPSGGKTFRQYHINSKGQRKPGIKGILDEPPVFNLPLVKNAIKKQITVFVVEGEKHAMQLRAEGLAATTNNGGAGKWRAHHSDQLAGAYVVILPDNDAPGRDHAHKVATSLNGKAKEIRILELPDLQKKGDVIDFLQNGGNYERQIETLKKLARTAPIFQQAIPADIPVILETLACTSTEFLAKKFKRPQVLLRPILRDQSLTMIYAKAGAGKSFLIHSIATALTRSDYEDIEIGPWTVRRQCGVLLIDGELPAGEIQDRLKGMAKSMGKESEDHPLQVLTAEEIAVNFNQQLNLTNPLWREAISSHLAKHSEYKIVVIDNISSLVPGVNENAKQDWDPINQWLLSLRRTGNSVILIHHANKKGGDRGHSGRLDNLDNVIVLEDVGAADQVKFQVIFQKCRYLKPGDGKPFILELTESKGGFSWKTEAVKESDKTLKEVVRLLSEKRITQRQVADEIGISQSRVSQLRRAAIKYGYLGTKNRLTEDGKEYLAEDQD